MMVDAGTAVMVRLTALELELFPAVRVTV
jgi:hypothetical protein